MDWLVLVKAANTGVAIVCMVVSLYWAFKDRIDLATYFAVMALINMK